MKELLVISQDTSAYGVDVKVPHRLLGWQARQDPHAGTGADLGEIAEPYGAWVRLHYVSVPQRG